MFPILFEHNNYIVSSWHFFFLLAAFSSYNLYMYLYKRIYPSLNMKIVLNFFLVLYFGGYFSARIFSIFNDQNIFSFKKIVEELILIGPMTFFGGAIGSCILGIIYLKSHKQNIFKYIDLAIPSCLLGVFWGRIGCFLNGDDYGKEFLPLEDAPWWTVVFHNHDVKVPRYPIQLMESFLSLFVCIFLVRALKKTGAHSTPGNFGLLGVIAYCTIRFFDEFYRGDDRGWFIVNQISTSQGISIIFFLLSFLILFIRNTKILSSK